MIAVAMGDFALAERIPKEWKDLPPVLGTQDVARVLGVHVNTVKNVITRKELKAFKVGRVLKIHRADLFEYVGLAENDD